MTIMELFEIVSGSVHKTDHIIEFVNRLNLGIEGVLKFVNQWFEVRAHICSFQGRITIYKAACEV